MKDSAMQCPAMQSCCLISSSSHLVVAQNLVDFECSLCLASLLYLPCLQHGKDALFKGLLPHQALALSHMRLRCLYLNHSLVTSCDEAQAKCCKHQHEAAKPKPEHLAQQEPYECPDCDKQCKYQLTCACGLITAHPEQDVVRTETMYGRARSI